MTCPPGQDGVTSEGDGGSDTHLDLLHASARDHGGDIDWAIVQYGGARADWIDLSTGINRLPYPVPALSNEVWHSLPTRAEVHRLTTAAADAYKTQSAIVALAGAQIAIQLVPRLMTAAHAAILAPTYNEYTASFEREGWSVREFAAASDLAGAEVAVVVNPNNPDGRVIPFRQLLDLVRKVRLLVVDESFMDPTPELSLAPHAGRGMLVLRSFGKFFGLAGLRLGFVVGDPMYVAKLEAMAGPWQVSGPAIEIGCGALLDLDWQRHTRQRLLADVLRLDACTAAAGWELIGGTSLFRLYKTPDAASARSLLARHKIWSRIFPWSAEIVRLGLPGQPIEWTRLEEAMVGLR